MELVGEDGWWLGEDIPSAANDGKFKAPGGDSGGILGEKTLLNSGFVVEMSMGPEG